jgi:hypothetical protein
VLDIAWEFQKFLLAHALEVIYLSEIPCCSLNNNMDSEVTQPLDRFLVLEATHIGDACA